MKTHYWNAYRDLSQKEGFFIEQSRMFNSIEEAIQHAVHYPDWVYSYTLEVSLESARRIDLEREILNARFPDEDGEGARYDDNRKDTCNDD